MKIIVCIKQVPGSAEVKINSETLTLDRTSAEAIINPFDENAIEEAAQIAGKYENVVVSVLSMGPPSAEKALKDALTFGFDEAYLLTDRAFAGADTLATAYTLSKAIEKIGDYDLILCGKQAIDGDTAQVGPGIAENLNIPQVTNVRKIDLDLANRVATVESELDDGYKIIKVNLPALITVNKEINVPRIPSFKDARRALKIPIKKWGKDDLDLDQERIGMDGSPTTVVKVETPKIEKHTILLTGEPGQVAEKLIQKLITDHLI
ncbi:MAG: electron transfer flavoprotein subunit beta [Candidatus Lokiarchaeota archaeon]|nr:electron transfer flavoprotein subunit beta [Candidatus Lokiarchaeota archaeon]